uniref:Secreted protein n=1 Tax=Macrostomum lignano TaxID=282301 RepID=A0A1I8IF26_9PLAT
MRRRCLLRLAARPAALRRPASTAAAPAAAAALALLEQLQAPATAPTASTA